MAEVYRGYHENLDRYVAIKILHAFLADDDEFRVRFEKEARHIAKLRHPHIVQVYDFDYSSDRDSYYMVMEMIDGVTLKDKLFDLAAHNQHLSIKETLRIIREAASALAYAHNRGMIHRDVKPANLMIDTDERVVLTDFGIAKMLDAKQLTISGGMIGTPAYMSPEQGLGEPGDERSDIYSLGVIMYQLLVGKLPYDAETALGVILMHVNDPIPDVRHFNPETPLAVQAIVNRAMAKDPNQRYQTAEEMIADIQRFENGEAVSTVGKVDNYREIKTVTNAVEGAFTPAEIDFESVEVTPPAPDEHTLELKVDERQKARRGVPLIVASLVLIMVAAFVGGYVFLRDDLDEMPWVSALLASATPLSSDGAVMVTLTPTMTETALPTNTPDLLASATAEFALALSQTPDVTATPTFTEVVATTAAPSDTPEPTYTYTPSATPNQTLTATVQLAATLDACTFDYAIIEQIPADGAEGDFFPVNQPYMREITLLNTGTCEWGENTSLSFVSGEDFNAGPRIFVRESVQVGEEYTLTFNGTTPGRGSVEPTTGTWQLRTRFQIPIGEPFEISVMVFDPGT